MDSSGKLNFDALLDELPTSLREGVRLWQERLHDQEPQALAHFAAAGGDIGAMVRLAACSEFAGNVAIRHWPWFAESWSSGVLDEPHDRRQLESRFHAMGGEDVDGNAFKLGIRVLRNQALLRILWRDLICGCSVEETLRALSDLADLAIDAATRFVARDLTARFGVVRGGDGVAPLVVLAMGKLGGRELNFSSDVDLIFAYPGGADSDGARSITAHEYFTRYARQVVAVLEEVNGEGFVYRVDTRLRPFGDSGPPVVSFAALETYLVQHGRGWERYAYVKARVVVPQAEGAVTALIEDVVEPFVYRRYLDYGVFESLREMKALVAAEVRKREMADNIKLGPGGIREIEFIVQSLQLVRGGNVQGLRTTELRAALAHATDERDLTRSDAERLRFAYDFLRRIENSIQAVRDQQVHKLPHSAVERDRLAFAMRYASWDMLAADIEEHRKAVSARFATIAFRGRGEPSSTAGPSTLSALWAAGAGVSEWRQELEQLGLQDSEELAGVITRFADMPSTQRIDSVAADRLRKLMPSLVTLLSGREHQAVTLQRVLQIVDKVLRRSAYIALLNENAAVLERLLDFCERSRYLAEEIGRFPALLDEMLDPRLYSRAPDAGEMRADLAQRLGAVAAADSEQQVEVLGQFQRAALFRLAVADMSGNIPIMKVSDRLTELAEIILECALDIAYADIVARHGEPRYLVAGRLRTAGFGIIAYGKLGGMELSYGSDLDLVFLHDSHGEQQYTSGEKSLENSMFFARLVRRLVHFLTAQTGSGALYEVDTRLRPSGRSGLLVTSIEAFERYQEENAWTWEHQALLRARPVAGSAVVAREFERIRTQTLRARVHRDTLRDDVRSMRARMRKQLDTSGAGHFDLKQGEGGIGDIEFLVQYLVLANAAEHPAVIHYPDNIRQLGTLAAAGLLTEEEGRRLQETYKTYRALLHRLALDDKPSLADADEFKEERSFVTALWARTLGGDD